MAPRHLPQRVCDFLLHNEGRPYCDTCIQERLGLKWRQQVQLITGTLATTKLFSRRSDRCCVCNEVKNVTAALRFGPKTESIAATKFRLKLKSKTKPDEKTRAREADAKGKEVTAKDAPC